MRKSDLNSQLIEYKFPSPPPPLPPLSFQRNFESIATKTIIS